MEMRSGPAPSAGERVQKLIDDNANALKYTSLLALFVLVWALIFRPVQKEIVGAMRGLGTGSANSIAVAELTSGAEDAGDEFDKLLAADTTTVSLKRRLTEMVQAEPGTMTRTLQSWLQESEG